MKLMMTYFIVFLMLGSVLGFVLSDSAGNPNRLTYNGYRIDVMPNRYILNYEREKLEFVFSPFEAEMIIIPPELIDNLRAVPYFTISYDPNMVDSGELSYIRSMVSQYSYLKDKLVGFAITEDSFMYDGISILNCDNSTRTSPIIVYQDSNEDNIQYNPETGCIIVSSSNVNHRVQFSERIVYEILGVMGNN